MAVLNYTGKLLVQDYRSKKIVQGCLNFDLGLTVELDW